MSNNAERLQITLDRLPFGEDSDNEEIRVTSKLPENVKSSELYKDVVNIAWPSFVELLLTQLVSMVDLMMVGKIGGTANPQFGVQALSAVGLTTQPKFLLMTAFIAMNTGVTALVARNKGNGDKEAANRVVRQGMLFTFIATAIVSVLGYIFAEEMVVFMGSTEDAITVLATQYLRIQLIGFVTMALTSVVTASLRAVGDSKTCMVYNLIANLVNVVFNWLLIYGNLGCPQMGVAGASIATVIGQTVAFVIAFAVIFRGNGFLKLELSKGFKPHKETLYNMIQIGIPAMIEQLLMRVGIIIFAILIAKLGTVAYATHQVCMNIQALSFMTGQAFAVSATSLVGQSLGKRRTDMAQAYCSRTQRIGMLIAIILAIIFAVFGRQLVGAYNNDPQIVEMGGTIMFFLAFTQPFQTSQFILAGGLRGAGDTRTTAVITTITVLILRPLLAFIFIDMGMGLYGAWLAMAVDQLVRALLVYLRYRSGKWKMIRLHSETA